MAKKEGKQDGDKKSKKKKPFLKKLLILFILAALGGGGFFVYDRFFMEKPGKVPESELDEEILIFASEKMPAVHAGLNLLGNEIIYTKNEINRIETIEKQFPDQTKITGSEKKLWEKNLAGLQKFRQKQEKDIRDIYVSFRVNEENGTVLIEENKAALAESTEEIIKVSQTLTEKIRMAEEAKGFLEKLKDKLF